MDTATQPRQTDARPTVRHLGYVRVSGDGDDARQRGTIREALDGADPERWYRDDTRGTDVERTQLFEMLESVEDGDIVVCASADRFARSVVDLDHLVSNLTDAGVTVRFVEEDLTFTPEGAETTAPCSPAQLQRRVLAACAELERSMARERQREGIDAARARGAYKGRAPRLTPDQVEVARARAGAGVPKVQIARELGCSRQTLYSALSGTCAYGP